MGNRLGRMKGCKVFWSFFSKRKKGASIVYYRFSVAVVA